jgi:hypothetical protein
VLPGDDRVPSGAALAAACAAPFFLLLSTVGMAALRSGFEGVRPMVAALAGAFLALAAMLISITGRWLSSKLGPPAVSGRHRMLAIAAFAGLLVGSYVFFTAAPGAPASADSWGGLIAAVVGLWVGLTALALLGSRLMWGFVCIASAALLSASVAVALL